jgi:hypothetical protein
LTARFAGALHCFKITPISKSNSGLRVQTCRHPMTQLFYQSERLAQGGM